MDSLPETLCSHNRASYRKLFDWRKESNKWKHLQGIAFPKKSTVRPIADILICIDCLDLHFSYEDVQGFPGDPNARRTPLGWTCIGNPNGKIGNCVQTNFIHAHLVRGEAKLEEIDLTLCRFWEIEACLLYTSPSPRDA